MSSNCCFCLISRLYFLSHYISLPLNRRNCFSCICYCGGVAVTVVSCYYSSFLVMLIHRRQRFKQKSKHRHLGVVKISHWWCTLQFWKTVLFDTSLLFSQMVKQTLHLQWSESRTMFSCLKHNNKCQVLVSTHLNPKRRAWFFQKAVFTAELSFAEETEIPISSPEAAQIDQMQCSRKPTVHFE